MFQFSPSLRAAAALLCPAAFSNGLPKVVTSAASLHLQHAAAIRMSFETPQVAKLHGIVTVTVATLVIRSTIQ